MTPARAHAAMPPWSPAPPPTPPPHPRTKWTRRVPHPVLIGHASSLTPYYSDATLEPAPRWRTRATCSRPSARRTRPSALQPRTRARSRRTLSPASSPRAPSAPPPPPPPSYQVDTPRPPHRTKWTRRVPPIVRIGHAASPPIVLIGHAASLSQVPPPRGRAAPLRARPRASPRVRPPPAPSAPLLRRAAPPPGAPPHPTPPRTNRTHLVLSPVLSGHVSSLPPAPPPAPCSLASPHAARVRRSTGAPARRGRGSCWREALAALQNLPAALEQARHAVVPGGPLPSRGCAPRPANSPRAGRPTVDPLWIDGCG